MKQESKEIDLKELLAACLIRWKLIALVGIVGAVIGLGYAWYSNQKAEAALAEAHAKAIEAANESTEEDQAKAGLVTADIDYNMQLSEAKSKLSDLEISKVDGLYAQYHENISMRDRMAKSISDSAVMQLDAESAVVLRSLYVLETDQMYLANNISAFVLDDDFYVQAASILGNGIQPEMLDDLFGVWKGDNGGSGDTVYVEQEGRSTSLIYLQAFAFTNEQAEEIIELIEQRLEKAVKEFEDEDPDIKLTSLGVTNLNVTSSTVQDIQRNLINELNGVAGQIVSIELNEIRNLSEDEKTYYELLCSRGKGAAEDSMTVSDEEDSEDSDVTEYEPVTTNSASYAKFIAFGVIGGIMLALVWLFLYLLLCKRICSRSEVEAGTGLSTIAVYDTRKPGKDPIVNSGMRMQAGDMAIHDAAGYAEILSTRVKALMEQKGCKSLYVFDSQESPLQSGSVGAQAVCGTPEHSETDMQQFLASDSAIIVTRIMETEEAALANAVNLCKVHDKPILGNIVIYGA